MKNSYRIIEICSLLFCFMISSTLAIAFNNYINFAKVDAWMCPIIGSIVGIIPFLMYIYIIKYENSLNIHEKNIKLFGNIFGKFINIILTIFIILFLMIQVYNLISFISSEYLYNTPKLFISFFFIIAFIYLFSINFKVLCRASIIFTFIALILFVFSVFGLFTQVNFNNLFPILEYGIKGPIIGTISHIGYIVLPTFFITMIPKNRIKNNNNYSKWLIITYIISSICVILITLFTLSIFGIDLVSLYQFPVFHVLKRALISSVFERIESILAIQWIIYIFLTITICIYYIMSGIESIFCLKKFKYKKWIYNILIIILFLTGINLFEDTTIANLFFTNIFPYLLYIFLFIIPIIICLKIKFSKNSYQK